MKKTEAAHILWLLMNGKVKGIELVDKFRRTTMLTLEDGKIISSNPQVEADGGSPLVEWRTNQLGYLIYLIDLYERVTLR